MTPRSSGSQFVTAGPGQRPLVLALAALAAFVVFSLFVPVYQATHLLEANQDFVVFKGVMPTSRNLAGTEKQLIFTDLVLDAALNDPDIQGAPDFESLDKSKQSLRENLSVGNAGTDSLLTISFKHPDAKMSALICNRVTEAYLAQRERFDNERILNLESWLSPSIDSWKSDVQTHENRVKELSKTALGFDPTMRVEGLEHDLSILGSLRGQLANLLVEEEILEARVAMQEANNPSGSKEGAGLPEIEIPAPTSAEIENFVNSDREVVSHRRLLAEREAMVRSMEDLGTSNLNQSYYKELKKQVADKKAEIELAEKAARSNAPDALRRHAMEVAQRNRAAQLLEMKVSSASEREAQKQQLAEIKAKRAIVQQEYDVEKARLEQQGGDAAELRFAQEDREMAVGILAKLNERAAAIKTERRRGSGMYTLAEATPPSKPIEPMPMKQMVVAAAGGFMVPFLIGLLFEFRSQRICDISSLDGKAIAPVVGEVAKLPSKVWRWKTPAGVRGEYRHTARQPDALQRDKRCPQYRHRQQHVGRGQK